MGPELFHPDQFGLKGSRSTKESDCYALGMVIYEVLNGKAPFAGSKAIAVMWKVTKGERPKRPEGAQGSWFTDDLWGMLNRCWASQLKSRPNIKSVFECLEQVSKAWKLPPEQVNEDPEKDEDDWDLTALIVLVRFLVSIPFTLYSCGGFRTDYASDPLLGLTPLGSQLPSREQEKLSRTTKFEKVKTDKGFVPPLHRGKRESWVGGTALSTSIREGLRAQEEVVEIPETRSLLRAQFRTSDFR